MATKKVPPTGHRTISHCSVSNQAASVSDAAAAALQQLAKASAAHAVAVGKIADALKGAEAHMNTGISIIGV